MIRILLVDDESIIREGIETMIPYASLNLSLTGSCTNAIEALESMADNMPDILVTDIRMPEMDGREATRRIRALDREDVKTLPIIALTANAFDEDVQRSMQAGLNAHLSKPVAPDALFETLETLIS